MEFFYYDSDDYDMVNDKKETKSNVLVGSSNFSTKQVMRIFVLAVLFTMLLAFKADAVPQNLPSLQRTASGARFVAGIALHHYVRRNVFQARRNQAEASSSNQAEASSSNQLELGSLHTGETSNSIQTELQRRLTQVIQSMAQFETPVELSSIRYQCMLLLHWLVVSSNKNPTRFGQPTA